MFFWSQYPALRIFIPFALGILFGFYDLFSFLPALLFLGICVVICLIYGRRSRLYPPSLIFGWLLLGISLQLMHSDKKYRSDLELCQDENTRFLASLKEIPSIKGNLAHALANIHSIRKNGKWIPTQTSVYLSLDKTHGGIPEPQNLFSGIGKFSPIPPPNLPEEFDFRSHLKKKDVFIQCKLSSQDVSILPTERPLWNHEVFAARAGAYTRKILENIGLNNAELAVGTALIMGNDVLLEPETVRSYAATGALHILSVSGLHVGIVYLLLSHIMKFIFPDKKKGLLRLVLLLAGIWCYSIATGLSSSVVRSANMLSIMIVGETLNKKGFSVNTLAASALMQCLLQPASLLEPGFQLSYLAVFGILTVYRPLKRILDHPHPVLSHLASLCSVSLAAQIFTSPISIYYFQQFPNYFLPANLIIIPVSGIVLYSGLALLVFHAIPFLNQLNAFTLKYALRLMNHLVDFFARLPYSVIENIGLNFIEMINIYLIIICVLLFFMHLRLMWLRTAMLGLSLFILLSIIENIRQIQQDYWEIFSTQQETAVAVIRGKKMYLFAKSKVHESGTLKKKLMRHWNLLGITKIEPIPIDKAKKLPLCLEIALPKNKKTLVIHTNEPWSKKTPNVKWRYRTGSGPVKLMFTYPKSSLAPLSSASPSAPSAACGKGVPWASEATTFGGSGGWRQSSPPHRP